MSDRPAIEIYSIGTELLNGQIQDTNSFWMAQQIAALGGYVRRIAILDDDMDELTGVLKDACQRGARVVITTGGLWTDARRYDGRGHRQDHGSRHGSR